jgi:AraC-like DNA-binding protein
VLATAGRPYVVLSEPGASAIPIEEARRQGSDHAPGAASTLLCGAYVLDGSVAASLLGGLPALVVVRAADQHPSHAAAIDLLAAEVGRDVPGQQALLDRLLDLNLIYTLSSWWEQSGAAAPGWYRALSHPDVRRVLENLHTDPARDWTLETMARLAGMSRAAFAAKFKELVGQSPGRYLTNLRMGRAEDDLTRTTAPLATIARNVGYSNEFAFATAFRRHHGTSPGQWRKRFEPPSPKES